MIQLIRTGQSNFVALSHVVSVHASGGAIYLCLADDQTVPVSLGGLGEEGMEHAAKELARLVAWMQDPEGVFEFQHFEDCKGPDSSVAIEEPALT